MLKKMFGFYLKFLALFVIFIFNSSVIAVDYHAAYKNIEVNSADTDEKIPVSVIYPTKTSAVPVRFGPFELELAIGAKIAEDNFPLVIVSHGSGGTNLGHRSIALELVKKGFIVAMPLHPKNNYKDNSAEGTRENWINRPKHIKAVIDYIVNESPFSSHVIADKVVVIGHSAGGYTALAVAGGVANTEHLHQLCISAPKVNQVFCGIGAEPAEKFKSEEIKNSRDKRVKAIVLMAPVGVLFKSEDSLVYVDASMLLLRAEKDDQLGSSPLC